MLDVMYVDDPGRPLSQYEQADVSVTITVHSHERESVVMNSLYAATYYVGRASMCV